MSVTPTATDRSARALAKRLIAKKGRTLLLRQPTRLEIESGPDIGLVFESPLSTRSLFVQTAATAGAVAVSLHGVGVRGLLVAGDRLVFAGHTQVYVVTGGPYPASSDALAAVAITPALAQNVAAEVAVTVSFNGTDTGFKGFPTAAKWRMVDGHLTRIGEWEVLVAQQALDELGVALRKGDVVFLGADDTAERTRLLSAEPLPSGELDAAVTLLLEAA